MLARAAIVGGQLRETTEGLEVLKEEVMSLRESIRWVKTPSCLIPGAPLVTALRALVLTMQCMCRECG